MPERICGTCKKTTLHEVQGTGWLWCGTCGTIIELIPGSIAARGCRVPGLLSTPTAAFLLLHAEKPGLFAVAAGAIEEARKSLSKVDQASLLRDSPIFDALESLHEAQLAVLTELQARDAEPPTGPERLAPFVLEKAIADGVVAVERERERCARIAETERLDHDRVGPSLGVQIAQAIRRGPK